jgi:phosphoglycolate phosphatase-like HAD superfamily hydrolase
MSIKLIIFDFDGTLADTFVIVEKIIDKYKKDYNLEYLTDADIQSFRGQEIWEIIKKLEIPIIKVPFLIARIRSSLRNLIDEVKPFDGIDKVIKGLNQQGFELGIVTTNSIDIVQRFLENYNLNYFTFIKSANFFLGKSQIINDIISSKAIDKEQVIYIGDETRDIEACQSIGIKIISVTWGYQTREILSRHSPDYLVDRPDSILKTI